VRPFLADARYLVALALALEASPPNTGQLISTLLSGSPVCGGLLQGLGGKAQPFVDGLSHPKRLPVRRPRLTHGSVHTGLAVLHRLPGNAFERPSKKGSGAVLP
jgi:hypothetical protein